jgi:8-oxo-dGTP diphosphatase
VDPPAETPRRQRVAAYAVIVRDGHVLLSLITPRIAPGEWWTLPGGGIDFGEDPADAVVREVHEETGLTAAVGDLLGVHDEHFTGIAPTGREEDFHGVALVFAATVAAGEPVVERGGTSDAAAWVPLADIASGTVEVSGVVTAGLGMVPGR